MNPKLNLIALNTIQAEKVKWLWYPYLPRGKISIVQGDPGDGKTTFVLALISLLTRGLPMPGAQQTATPRGSEKDGDGSKIQQRSKLWYDGLLIGKEHYGEYQKNQQ